MGVASWNHWTHRGTRGCRHPVVHLHHPRLRHAAQVQDLKDRKNPRKATVLRAPEGEIPRAGEGRETTKFVEGAGRRQDEAKKLARGSAEEKELRWWPVWQVRRRFGAEKCVDGRRCRQKVEQPSPLVVVVAGPPTWFPDERGPPTSATIFNRIGSQGQRGNFC